MLEELAYSWSILTAAALDAACITDHPRPQVHAV